MQMIAVMIALATLISCNTPQPATPKAPPTTDELLPLPTSVSLAAGQNLVVVLPLTQGKKLAWRPQSPLSPILSLTSDTVQTAMLGSGAADRQVLTFTANKVGEAELTLLLVRPNDRNATPVEIRKTMVVVSAPQPTGG